MPTLILVDTSFSMLSPLEDVENENQSTNRRNLVITGLTHFTQLLQETNKQEFVALATFSHNSHLVQTYTHDYANIVLACTRAEFQSKTNYISAFESAVANVNQHWGCGIHCQVILITDGLSLDPDFDSTQLHRFLPLASPSYLHIVCLSLKQNCRQTEDFWLNLIRRNQTEPEKALHFLNTPNSQGAKELFSNLAETFYSPCYALIKCGSFCSAVQITPPIKKAQKKSDFEIIDVEMANTLEIIGFSKTLDFGNPPFISRHLVLALGTKKNSNSKEDDKTCNLCVLLHGSLKVEGMAAVCQIGPDWYGVIYHLPEAKRSNLTLNCFEPGSTGIPWLGRLSALNTKPYQGSTATPKNPFVVPQRPKPSYGLNPTCWIETYGLQSDVQKIIRYARKLPDRQNQFYQDINRVLSHALAVGFTSLIEKIASSLERETKQPNVNPELKKHCSYVMSKLRSGNLTYGEQIKPPGK